MVVKPSDINTKLTKVELALVDVICLAIDAELIRRYMPGVGVTYRLSHTAPSRGVGEIISRYTTAGWVVSQREVTDYELSSSALLRLKGPPTTVELSFRAKGE